jgi:hypothetical protein
MAGNRKVPHSYEHGKEEFPFGANAPDESEDTAVQEQPQESGTAGPAPSANGTASGPDPFDPASLRVAPTAGATLGVKKVLLTIPVDKPNKSWWFRCHPSADYRLTTYILEDGRDRYLIAPALHEELQTEPTCKLKLLATCINRQGVLFVWPLNLPQEGGGRGDNWARSAMEALEMSAHHWVRVVANMDLGANDVLKASAALTEPEWPPVSFAEVLRIAFKDKFIDRPDHPVLRRLRGEV